MALPFNAVVIPQPSGFFLYNFQQDTTIKSYALTLNRSHLIVKLLQTSFMSGCEEMMLWDVSCAEFELEAAAAAATADDDDDAAAAERTPHRNSSRFTAN